MLYFGLWYELPAGYQKVPLYRDYVYDLAMWATWVRAENADLMAAAFQRWTNRRMLYPRIVAWFN